MDCLMILKLLFMNGKNAFENLYNPRTEHYDEQLYAIAEDFVARHDEHTNVLHDDDS